MTYMSYTDERTQVQTDDSVSITLPLPASMAGTKPEASCDAVSRACAWKSPESDAQPDPRRRMIVTHCRASWAIPWGKSLGSRIQPPRRHQDRRVASDAVASFGMLWLEHYHIHSKRMNETLLASQDTRHASCASKTATSVLGRCTPLPHTPRVGPTRVPMALRW